MNKIIRVQVVKPITVDKTKDIIWARDGYKFKEDPQGIFVIPPLDKIEIWIPNSNIACIVREQEKVGTQSRITKGQPKQEAQAEKAS